MRTVPLVGYLTGVQAWSVIIAALLDADVLAPEIVERTFETALAEEVAVDEVALAQAARD